MMYENGLLEGIFVSNITERQIQGDDRHCRPLATVLLLVKLENITMEMGWTIRVIRGGERPEMGKQFSSGDGDPL
jgi:hypothetical protein